MNKTKEDNVGFKDGEGGREPEKMLRTENRSDSGTSRMLNLQEEGISGEFSINFLIFAHNCGYCFPKMPSIASAFVCNDA